MVGWSLECEVRPSRVPVSSRGQDTWFSATGPGFESPYRYQAHQKTNYELSKSRPPTAIVIKWAYGSQHQMPPPQVNREQLAFETALDPLADAENSELVHVSTGIGLKEWIYYARRRDAFMADFNRLLSSQPAYPLQIEFFDDPEWKVWGGIVDDLRSHDET
jgi:Family of unknown function (DUF695)